MSEIQNNSNKESQKHGFSTKSTKIDMTPMVDLGFLLITFFMLTTTLQKPSQMQLNMPDNSPLHSEYPASKTLALIPGPQNQIFYFRGDLKNTSTIIGNTDYSAAGLRNVILKNKEIVEEMPNSKDKFLVIVMPMDKATYKNVIDLLDELAITETSRYGIVEPDESLISRIKNAGYKIN
jgi:biopolymer transport protein ExbD